MCFLVLFVALLSACGDGSQAPDGAVTPVTTAPEIPTGPAATEDRAPGAGISSPTSAATGDGAPTTRPSDLTADPRFVVASDGGVVRYEDGVTTELAHDPAAIAFDDGAGGALMQFTEGFHASTEEDTSIYHARVGTDEPVPVVEGNVDVTLRLHGPVVSDEQVLAVYSVRRGATPQDASEELFTYDVGTGDTRRVLEVGGWEYGPVSVSAGGGLYLLNTSAEASRWFEFVAATGTPVEVEHNPLPPGSPCADDVTCPDHPALDPTGSRLAYTQLVPGDDGVIRSWELVVLDLRTGATLLRLPQQYDAGFAPRAVDTVGGLVVVSRGSADVERPTWSEPLVVDLSGAEPTVSTLPVRGLATLARAE